MRRAFTTGGRITEHNRQKRHAEMLTKEILKKDRSIDKETKVKIQQIRRTTIRRKKSTSAADAQSFLSRTKQPW